MEVEGTHPQMSNNRGVIFLLNNLSYDFDPEDDFPGTVPNHPYRPENVAATYLLPLEQILSSGLNAADFIRAIYVNFGPMGYYELNPNTWPITPPAAFEALIDELFQPGIISNPDNQLIWRNITNLSNIVSTLPTNCIKIGCMHGAGSRSQGSINYEDYITAASDEQIHMFVVGQIDTQIHSYIDEFVKVSNYDLVPSQCLSRVISAMERKLGIS